MTNYRRNFLRGGCYFFTVNLADHKLTEAELQQYREGRLKAALAQ